MLAVSHFKLRLVIIEINSHVPSIFRSVVACWLSNTVGIIEMTFLGRNRLSCQLTWGNVADRLFDWGPLWLFDLFNFENILNYLSLVDWSISLRKSLFDLLDHGLEPG